MSGLTLDAGGLIALDRNSRRVALLLDSAQRTGATITVPTTALAQAIRQPARQARLSRLIGQPTTKLAPLDAGDATLVGVLLGASRTTDLVDAHVVICASRNGDAIVTSDPRDLELLDPDAPLIVV